MFPAGSAQDSIAREMCAVLVVEAQLVSACKLYVAAMDINLLRDKGPEIRGVATPSCSVLPDYTWECQYLL